MTTKYLFSKGCTLKCQREWKQWAARGARNGSGHIRRRTDGRWEAQYYFEGEKRSCYGSTEEECRHKLELIHIKIYKGTYRDASSMPLYVYLDRWNHQYIEVRPSTHTSYDGYIDGHIYNHQIGSIPLNKLKLEDFIRFFRDKQTEGRRTANREACLPKHSAYEEYDG